MDVTCLYTVIPKNEGLQALKYFFGQRPIKKPSTETLLRLAELVLTLFIWRQLLQANQQSWNGNS